jgi:hypothetical protein
MNIFSFKNRHAISNTNRDTMLVFLCCLLSACGGNGSLSKVSPPTDLAPPKLAPPQSTIPNVITTLKVQNLSAAQTNVPITFGQVFAKGDVPTSSGVAGKLDSGTDIPLQFEVKAKHDDGSVRHAIISTNFSQLDANKIETINLVKGSLPINVPAATPSNLLNTGFTAVININVGSVAYSASASDLLRAGNYKQWLAGNIANEWQISAPLKTSQGQAHPHLTARFAIRNYSAQNRTRVDVTIENNWAYEPAPQNITYDVNVQVAGKSVYQKNALTHYHHARWRKVFWTGVEPQVHLIHNTSYLIASKALPNFDQSTLFTPANITPIKTKFAGAVTEPMGSGVAEPYMPAPGGRPDIGLLPGWATTYLLTQDKDAKAATLGTADLAGSWSMHYRDKNTDRPVSLIDYPYMTILGNASDTLNPVTKRSESFPACGGVCTNPNTAESSHQPSFSYLPYLVTGDYYHLEELQFWAMWNLFQSNPGYRAAGKGLFNRTQVRGQAWIMRNLANAAYATPDTDSLKQQFKTFMTDNLDWYNQTYSNSSSSNFALGALLDGNSTEYNNGRGIAPWQDDFFTSAVAHANELGFTQAKALLNWKAKFPISRMTGTGYCWILGSIYSLNVRDSSTSSYYTNVGQAYLASSPNTLTSLACASAEMATNLSLKVGEMTGYSSEATGFPSNMQPALAMSADSDAVGGLAAWNVFNKRSVKPNYATGPQFSIVPRSIK